MIRNTFDLNLSRMSMLEFEADPHNDREHKLKSTPVWLRRSIPAVRHSVQTSFSVEVLLHTVVMSTILVYTSLSANS
jgi:hypothetical protein